MSFQDLYDPVATTMTKRKIINPAKLFREHLVAAEQWLNLLVSTKPASISSDVSVKAKLMRLAHCKFTSIDVDHLRGGVDGLLDSIQVLGRIHDTAKEFACHVGDSVERPLEHCLQVLQSQLQSWKEAEDIDIVEEFILLQSTLPNEFQYLVTPFIAAAASDAEEKEEEELDDETIPSGSTSAIEIKNAVPNVQHLDHITTGSRGLKRAHFELFIHDTEGDNPENKENRQPPAKRARFDGEREPLMPLLDLPQQSNKDLDFSVFDDHGTPKRSPSPNIAPLLSGRNSRIVGVHRSTGGLARGVVRVAKASGPHVPEVDQGPFRSDQDGTASEASSQAATVMVPSSYLGELETQTLRDSIEPCVIQDSTEPESYSTIHRGPGTRSPCYDHDDGLRSTLVCDGVCYQFQPPPRAPAAAHRADSDDFRDGVQSLPSSGSPSDLQNPVPPNPHSQLHETNVPIPTGTGSTPDFKMHSLPALRRLMGKGEDIRTVHQDHEQDDSKTSRILQGCKAPPSAISEELFRRFTKPGQHDWRKMYSPPSPSTRHKGHSSCPRSQQRRTLNGLARQESQEIYSPPRLNSTSAISYVSDRQRDDSPATLSDHPLSPSARAYVPLGTAQIGQPPSAGAGVNGQVPDYGAGGLSVIQEVRDEMRKMWDVVKGLSAAVGRKLREDDADL